MANASIGTTVGKNAAALSKLTVAKPVVAAKPAPKPAPPPPKPASVVNIGKSPPNLGLYSAGGTTAARPAAAPPPPPKPEILAVSAGGVVAGKGNVVVDIQASDSGYDNKIYYSTDNFKTKTYIGVDNQTGSVDLGSFKPGTKIQFGIDNGQGNFFRTGGAAANTDKFDHAKATKTAAGVTIGFEDLKGGGDRDFNDAIIQVRSVAPGSVKPSATVPAPAPATATAPPKTNASGLGDGTNPGQGGGTANSPNQGVNNPSALNG